MKKIAIIGKKGRKKIVTSNKKINNNMLGNFDNFSGILIVSISVLYDLFRLSFKNIIAGTKIINNNIISAVPIPNIFLSEEFKI